MFRIGIHSSNIFSKISKTRGSPEQKAPDWTLKGPRDPKNVPEAVFVQRLIDQFQPELLADIHGTNLDFERYIMFETSGTSYSNNALRPYYREIIRQMDEAALAEGFPSDTAESNAERIFFGPGLADMPSRCWLGRPRCYGAIYAYYHFHTIVSASEVGWDRSGVLRHRRLLQIGNERWPGEYYPGYPTRVILGNIWILCFTFNTTCINYILKCAVH